MILREIEVTTANRFSRPRLNKIKKLHPGEKLRRQAEAISSAAAAALGNQRGSFPSRSALARANLTPRGRMACFSSFDPEWENYEGNEREREPLGGRYCWNGAGMQLSEFANQ